MRALLEHVDERRADDLALLLGIGDVRQPVEEQIGRVHELERQLRGARSASAPAAASSSRSRPLSTKMQVSRSPIACGAASPRPSNRRRPTARRRRGRRRPSRESARCSRRRTTPSSSRRVQPQTSNAKLRRISIAAARCARLRGGTAGRRAAAPRSCIAATGALADVATTSKPGGAAATKSPWLAQTLQRRRHVLEQRRAGGDVDRRACPNSRCGALPTRPPSASVMSCMP